MKTVKTPTELLIRYGTDGTVAGAHVRWLYTTTENDTVLAAVEGPAEAVGLTEGATGFPLAALLEETHTAALAGVNRLTGEVLELRADKAAQREQIASLGARIADLEAVNGRLAAQLNQARTTETEAVALLKQANARITELGGRPAPLPGGDA